MHSSHAVEREWGGKSSYCTDSFARLARISSYSDDDTLRFMSVLSRRSFSPVAPLPCPFNVWVGSPLAFCPFGIVYERKLPSLKAMTDIS